MLISFGKEFKYFEETLTSNLTFLKFWKVFARNSNFGDPKFAYSNEHRLLLVDEALDFLRLVGGLE
jgi:hypothetical protein